LLTWDPTIGFFPGFFRSTDVTILGGDGASQFLDLFSGDQAWAFIMKIGTPDIAPWLYGGDVDIQLRSIPEPSTLIFLGTGLASLLGYGIRRRMA